MNIYGFVGNDGVNWIDVIGLQRFPGGCLDCGVDPLIVGESTTTKYRTKDTDKGTANNYVAVALNIVGDCGSYSECEGILKVYLFVRATIDEVDVHEEPHTTNFIYGQSQAWVNQGGVRNNLTPIETDPAGYGDPLASGRLDSQLIELGEIDCCGGELEGTFDVQYQVPSQSRDATAYSGEYSVTVEECGSISSSSVSLSNQITSGGLRLNGVVVKNKPGSLLP